jgi:hypothetical protein
MPTSEVKMDPIVGKAIEQEYLWLMGYINALERAGTHPAQIIEYLKNEVKERINTIVENSL